MRVARPEEYYHNSFLPPSVCYFLKIFVQPMKCPHALVWEETTGSTPLDKRAKPTKPTVCGLFHTLQEWLRVFYARESPAVYPCHEILAIEFVCFRSPEILFLIFSFISNCLMVSACTIPNESKSRLTGQRHRLLRHCSRCSTRRHISPIPVYSLPRRSA